MKIVYFGNNLFSSCLKYLISEGHQILRVYKNSCPTNSSIIDRLCANNGITLFQHKPNLKELEHLISQGAEMFVVAEYSYLIPNSSVKYAINIHPTLLPEGRGPTPLIHLIRKPEFSGVTIHKISDEFDAGDVILQSKLTHSMDESFTTLMIKIHFESAKLFRTFFENIDHHYKLANPQVDHSYWPKADVSERILDWNAPISEIKLQMKCFGHIGLIIKLDQEIWITPHLEVINYKHDLLPGHVSFEDDNLLAVNASDGIVCIHKSSMLSASTQIS